MGEQMDRVFYESMLKARMGGKPIARYIKAILGGVDVEIVDVFTGKPIVVHLRGNPAIPSDDMTVSFYTDFEHDFFRKANKELIDRGYVAPYTQEIIEVVSVNEITDDELKAALEKPFFAVKALLDKFTTTLPVQRLLTLAEELNKPAGTVNAIKARLSEMQGE